MIDKFNIKAKLMSGGGQVNSGSIGRTILSFADFKKKISLIPMDDEIRKIVLERVNKYPEASLDYVWKRLQDFVSAATRERAIRNKKLNTPPLESKIFETPQPDFAVVEVKEEAKKEKPKPVKPNLVRPSFSLEEYDIPNKEIEGEIKDDTVSKEQV